MTLARPASDLSNIAFRRTLKLPFGVSLLGEHERGLIDFREHDELESCSPTDVVGDAEQSVTKLDVGTTLDKHDSIKALGGHKAPFQSNTSGPDHKTSANVNGSLRPIHCPELTQITPALIPSPEVAGSGCAPMTAPGIPSRLTDRGDW